MCTGLLLVVTVEDLYPKVRPVRCLCTNSRSSCFTQTWDVPPPESLIRGFNLGSFDSAKRCALMTKCKALSTEGKEISKDSSEDRRCFLQHRRSNSMSQRQDRSPQAHLLLHACNQQPPNSDDPECNLVSCLCFFHCFSFSAPFFLHFSKTFKWTVFFVFCFFFKNYHYYIFSFYFPSWIHLTVFINFLFIWRK